MPRVTHVKKARKDNPVCKKGESYYWWQHAFSSKQYSIIRPRGSQLTKSAFYSQWRQVEESLEDICNLTEKSQLEEPLQEAAETIRALGEECQESLDNMPESLQCSPTAELLQERIDACEEYATVLDEGEGVVDEDDASELISTARDDVDREDFDEGEDGEPDYKAAMDEAESEAQDEYNGLLQSALDDVMSNNPGEPA